jgi:hypothetical protein
MPVGLSSIGVVGVTGPFHRTVRELQRRVLAEQLGTAGYKG